LAPLRYGSAAETKGDPDVSQRLSELVGTAPPEAVAALPAEQLDALADVIDAALRRQSEDLAASFDATLRYVPFPLRAIVRKVLTG
jgi:hypothetical protein